MVPLTTPMTKKQKKQQKKTNMWYIQESKLSFQVPRVFSYGIILKNISPFHFFNVQWLLYLVYFLF